MYALADSLPLEERFCLKIPNCMDPVDLSQIEAFYDRLGDEQGVSRKMRTLAQARLSWAEQMKKIVDAASQKAKKAEIFLQRRNIKMCGIAGFTCIDENSGSRLEKMLDKISHRGPNDTGQYLDDVIALGHKRLSILDLTFKGHQPFIIKRTVRTCIQRRDLQLSGAPPSAGRRW